MGVLHSSLGQFTDLLRAAGRIFGAYLLLKDSKENTESRKSDCVEGEKVIEYKIEPYYLGKGVRKAMKLKRTLVCLGLLLPLIAGCAGGNGGQKDTGTEPRKEPAEETHQTQPVETEPASVEVETPFGSLYYQAQWQELMRTEQEQTDDGVIVRFLAELDGTEYPLFTVTVGGSEANAGRITDAAGTGRNVFVELADPGDLSGLTEEVKNYLYAMQEEINYVIQKIK